MKLIVKASKIHITNVYAWWWFNDKSKRNGIEENDI